ncbi:MAG: hypothetical protein DHS20C12_03070 [Pseudohongiella sp.]|nr:MAG: hypothetical protein DHS20C12_03070 [Pseudohongiella sp.]
MAWVAFSILPDCLINWGRILPESVFIVTPRRITAGPDEGKAATAVFYLLFFAVKIRKKANA